MSEGLICGVSLDLLSCYLFLRRRCCCWPSRKKVKSSFSVIVFDRAFGRLNQKE
jgi:hypothetical protein